MKYFVELSKGYKMNYIFVSPASKTLSAAPRKTLDKVALGPSWPPGRRLWMLLSNSILIWFCIFPLVLKIGRPSCCWVRAERRKPAAQRALEAERRTHIQHPPGLTASVAGSDYRIFLCIFNSSYKMIRNICLPKEDWLFWQTNGSAILTMLVISELHRHVQGLCPRVITFLSYLRKQILSSVKKYLYMVFLFLIEL